MKTSAPLEIVCIDFWTTGDSNNKSVDVLVVTDHFTRLAQVFPCQISLLNRWRSNSGTSTCAFMDFLRGSTRIREPRSRVN